jgi:hypothetical protein
VDALSGDCAGDMGFVRAGDLSVGSCVATVSGNEKVVFVTKSSGEGVYTVVTSEFSGKVVVDGVIASSFGVNHVAANTFYSMHRAAYGILKAMGASTSLLEGDALVWSNAAFGGAALTAGKMLKIV